MSPDWPTCSCPGYPVPHPVSMGRCQEPVPTEPVTVAGAYAAVGQMSQLEAKTVLRIDNPATQPPKIVGWGELPPKSNAVRFELWRTADERLVYTYFVSALPLELDSGGYADWFPEFDLRDPEHLYPHGYPDGYEWRATYPDGQERQQAADVQLRRFLGDASAP